MDFIRKHGKRLEAVNMVEENKHGHGCMFVEVRKLENRYNVYHVPLDLIPHKEIKEKMKTVNDFDEIMYICLKLDDKQLRMVRVNKVHKTTKTKTKLKTIKELS